MDSDPRRSYSNMESVRLAHLLPSQEFAVRKSTGPPRCDIANAPRSVSSSRNRLATAVVQVVA